MHLPFLIGRRSDPPTGPQADGLGRRSLEPARTLTTQKLPSRFFPRCKTRARKSSQCTAAVDSLNLYPQPANGCAKPRTIRLQAPQPRRWPGPHRFSFSEHSRLYCDTPLTRLVLEENKMLKKIYLALSVTAALALGAVATADAKGHGGGHGGGHHGGEHHGGGHHGGGHHGGGHHGGGHHGGGHHGGGHHAGRGGHHGGHAHAHAARAMHGREAHNRAGHNHWHGRNAFGVHAAWNHWGHNWNRWGWGWPYFWGDVLSFVFWPYAVYNPFWFYGPNFILDTVFWPSPYGGYGYVRPYDIYGYGGYAYPPHHHRPVAPGTTPS